MKHFRHTGSLVSAVLLSLPVALAAQAPSAPGVAAQSATPRQSGTVKAVTPHDLVLTNAAGQDFAVNLSASSRILLVDPATRDVKSARAGSLADIAGGDKVIVTGTAGDTGQTLTATRILLLKSGAIQAMHEQEQAAWAHSVTGLVKATDAATGNITIAQGSRTYTVATLPATVVRRYAAGSVRFEDAVTSSVAAIRPGDQLQARGQRSPDGAAITADEIVTGSFSNFSGVLSTVDTGGSSVSLKDLATKHTVTVTITAATNLRTLSSGAGMRAANAGHAPARGGVEGGRPAASPAGGHPAEGQNATAQAATARGATTQDASAATASGSEAGSGGGGERGAGAGQPDLARLLPHLPQMQLADLKPGQAVMIVATNGVEGGRPTAVTLLSGVEQILAASPSGQATLSPWGLGGSSSGGEDAGSGSSQ